MHSCGRGCAFFDYNMSMFVWCEFRLAGLRDHMDGGFVIVHCSCFLYNQKNSRKIIDRKSAYSTKAFILNSLLKSKLSDSLFTINSFIINFISINVKKYPKITKMQLLYFNFSSLSSKGNVGKAKRSKSDSNSRSWMTRYFSNSVSAYSCAASWVTLPASVNNGRSSLFK